ncbi:MAG: SlyX family protein [Fuerstiella sp.]
MSDSAPEDVADRLLRIESALAHLQHDVDQLNQSLTNHFRRLQGFEERFTRIEHEIEQLGDQPESSDPVSEKPPHY